MLMCEQSSLKLNCNYDLRSSDFDVAVVFCPHWDAPSSLYHRCLQFGSLGVDIEVEREQVTQFTDSLCCHPLLLLPLLQRCECHLRPDPHLLTFVAKDSNGRSVISAVSNDWWKVWLRQSPTVKSNAEVYFSFHEMFEDKVRREFTQRPRTLVCTLPFKTMDVSCGFLFFLTMQIFLQSVISLYKYIYTLFLPHPDGIFTLHFVKLYWILFELQKKECILIKFVHWPPFPVMLFWTKFNSLSSAGQ